MHWPVLFESSGKKGALHDKAYWIVCERWEGIKNCMHVIICTPYTEVTLTLENRARTTVTKLVYTRLTASARKKVPMGRRTLAY